MSLDFLGLGGGRVRLGCAERPHWVAHSGVGRIHPARSRAGAGQPATSLIQFQLTYGMMVGACRPVRRQAFGAKLVLITGLSLQAVTIACYLFVLRLEEFYVLSLVFGAVYGGTMPHYAMLARESFGQRVISTVFGALTMVSAAGMSRWADPRHP